MLRHLSLFTGAGGGELAAKLLGWRTVGYVEKDAYCCKVITQRIKDRILDDAPIFEGDIAEFNTKGYARAYQGMVDVISAGFPCQPFSEAGSRKGAEDERNMWPATMECIRLVQPRAALLENVPGLLSSGYFGRILGDLAESGYDVRWRILSAAELGAPHIRKRLWMVANTNSTGRQVCQDDGGSVGSIHRPDRKTTQAHGIRQKCIYGTGEDGSNGNVANAYSESKRCHFTLDKDKEGRRPDRTKSSGSRSAPLANTQSKGLKGARGSIGDGKAHAGPAYPGWWEVEPAVGRVVDGLAYRVDRLKALGNGQVSVVAAAAWRILSGAE